MKQKGFTLIESLFAFSILFTVMISLISILYKNYYLVSLIDQKEKLEGYIERMEDQFYPVTNLEDTLEEVIDG